MISLRNGGSAMEMKKETIIKLIQSAGKAREKAYAPYSHFSVGASLLCEDGSIYQGCNVENAAYTPANCAERTAVFKAVSEGKREFAAIAVLGGKEGEEPSKESWCSPCGVCRQVLMEFVEPKEFLVIMAKNAEEYQISTLEELLPMGFGPANLK